MEKSNFHARLGLSWKISWNQSVLNLFCGLGLESVNPPEPHPSQKNETIQSAGGWTGKRIENREFESENIYSKGLSNRET